jgi:hypothetical protein
VSHDTHLQGIGSFNRARGWPVNLASAPIPIRKSAKLGLLPHRSRLSHPRDQRSAGSVHVGADRERQLKVGGDLRLADRQKTTGPLGEVVSDLLVGHASDFAPGIARRQLENTDKSGRGRA